MSGSSNSSMLCTVAIEHIGKNTRNIFKNASLTLNRNSLRDLALTLDHPKQRTSFLLNNVKVHSRFVKEGKATFSFSPENIQLMVSNCPSQQLSVFIKILLAKKDNPKNDKENLLAKNEGKETLVERMLLKTSLKEMDEISPLTVTEIKFIREKQNAKRKSNAVEDATPKKGGVKTSHTQKKLCLGSPIASQVSSSKNLSSLNDEQLKILKAVSSGKSVFFSGNAGTGKSYLLRRILTILAPDVTYATASTGVAACHIGGTTLHSFAGIGSGSASLQASLDALSKNKSQLHQWRKCKTLIIDEISMVNGDYFDKIEAVARSVRQNSSPFGGIQLVLCGDFLQLPPVTRMGEKRVFCFESQSWWNCVKLSMELKQVHRQKEPLFVQILGEIRLGRCPKIVKQSLESCQDLSFKYGLIEATQLCTHREDVDSINRSQLLKLPGPLKSFVAEDSPSALSSYLDSNCPSVKNIQLTIGTQVMLTKNLDLGRGLSNGARGVVVGFENSSQNLPIVKFVCGVQKTIGQERFILKGPSNKGGESSMVCRHQLPLKLAWALSIHKSQGMTLDCVEINLARIFECGQAYVALSRASSLKCLKVSNFQPSCIRADPKVLKFYERLNLRNESTNLGHLFKLGSK